jgi:hypothetical protein
MDRSAALWRPYFLPAPPYAPECLEGKFCELRRDGVVRSW